MSRQGPPLATELVPSLEAQQHRGPDDAGTWSDEWCALGHRRLAIIDLSPAARQPLSNEDGSIWLVFNGEIYNFQSLRAELESLGHRFRTQTDTEAVVHAYEQWSTECVRRLRGMFAFGIWDARRRRLFLARDRVGKKPLFYTQQGDRFLFASELQGLLANPTLPREVDLEALDQYLSWGYVPPPRTGFRGIYKLAAAHWMTVDLKDNGSTVGGDDPDTDLQSKPKARARLSTPSLVVHTERYWWLPYTPKWHLSEREAGEALREKLIEAVRLRLVSDVPLGAFLSGGIDSSIVVGLMAQISDEPVKTFSIGFEEAAFNELEHARRIAQRWATDHHEYVVRPDAISILPMLVRHYGEPYADSSAIPTFYVAKMTRQSVTVALNGDGGDENFAGYERYWANQIAEQIRRVPGSALAARALARLLPDSLNSKSRLRQARRFLAVANLPMVERYARWLSFFSEEEKAALYSGDMKALLQGERPVAWMESLFAETDGLDPAEAAMSVDIRSSLPYDLTVKVDITASANSLEGRAPFLDHEVMEFCARLPVSLKLRRGQSKYLLKREFTDCLPPENAYRRKMGFGVPVGQWFRTQLRDLLCDTLLSPRSLDRGYFQPEVVRRLVTDHVEGRADHTYPLWALLMLELWHQEMGVHSP